MRLRVFAMLLGFAAVAVTGCDKSSPKTEESSGGGKKDKDKEKAGKSDDDEPAAKKKKSKSNDDDDDKDESSPKEKEKEKEKVVLPAKTQVAASIKAYFAEYKDGSDFAFIEKYFAPKIEQFVMRKDVTPADMQKDAKGFYKDKTELKYEPMLAGLTVTPDASGERETAELVVRLTWKYPPPKAWGTDFPEGAKVSRQVDVVTDLVVGEGGKFVAYIEKEVKRPSYKVVDPDGSLGAYPSPPGSGVDDSKAAVKLTKGTIVQDLGETLVIGNNPKGDEVARKIRYQGKDYWAMDHGAIAVENPNGGTSAGEIVYLEKVK